ncbi:MFS transporter [Chitinimonas sp.]|uniref:MFS transporter n=1 Tax=Chitinimonas sp. TaxID=1934313 RepID=UPI002F9399F3
MVSNWRIYLLALVSFLVGTSEYVIAGTLDQIAAALGVSVTSAGQLITAFALVYALFTPLAMALTARLPRRRLLLGALAVFVLGNLLAFVVPGFGLLMLARVVMALGAGVVVVNALSIAAQIAPPGKQGSAIATVIMGFTVSLIIGMPLGRWIAAAHDWRSIFAGIAVLGALAMALIHRSLPQVAAEQAMPLREQLALLKQPRLQAALLVSFFWLGGFSVMFTYVSPFLLDVTRLGEGAVRTALFALGVASLVGSRFGGWSVDRFGGQRTLQYGLALHFLMLVLLGSFGAHALVVYPALMLWTFFAWSSGPAQQFNLVSLAPAASGIMLSLNNSTMQLARAAGAALGGLVVEGSSLAAIAWTGAAMILVAAAVSARAGRQSGALVLKPVTAA